MRVVTFGEIMMRLATPGRLRFSQAKELELTYGGGEANVAVSLANFGLDAAFVTRLPKNPFGDGAVRRPARTGRGHVTHRARRRAHRHLFFGNRRQSARLGRRL